MKRFAIAFAWLGVLTVCIVVVVLCVPHDHHGVQPHQSAHRLVSAPLLRQQVALLATGTVRVTRDAMRPHDRVGHIAVIHELDRGPRLPLLRI